MPDLYLQALMNRESFEPVSKKIERNRFDIEVENEIDEYIKTVHVDHSDKFMSPELQRSRLKMELIELSKLSELSSQINLAFKTLVSEGQRYLDKDEYILIKNEFAAANDIINELDPKNQTTESYKTLLLLSDATIDAIFKIAVSTFKELRYHESLSLFILLTVLVPENTDYWYRAGILAQECENYELALRLYGAATSLEPSWVAPWIFSIDCYLKCGMQPEAKAAYSEAIKINEASPADNEWKELLIQYQSIINKQEHDTK